MIPAIRTTPTIKVAIALVAVAIIVIYSVFDPSIMPFPRCVFLTLTGWECPGCGSQRALHSLLHLDIVTAWRYNALMVCAIPFVVAVFIADSLRTKYPAIHKVLNSRLIILIALIVILSWWLLRNLL